MHGMINLHVKSTDFGLLAVPLFKCENFSRKLVDDQRIALRFLLHLLLSIYQHCTIAILRISKQRLFSLSVHRSFDLYPSRLVFTSNARDIRKKTRLTDMEITTIHSEQTYSKLHPNNKLKFSSYSCLTMYIVHYSYTTKRSVIHKQLVLERKNTYFTPLWGVVGVCEWERNKRSLQDAKCKCGAPTHAYVGVVVSLECRLG